MSRLAQTTGDVTLQFRDLERRVAELEARSRTGVIARFQTATDDSARAAGADTDMTVTTALTAGRLYPVTLNAEVALTAAGVSVGIELEHDGAVVGRFWRIGDALNVAGAGPFQISATVDYEPTITDTAAVLTVANAAGSGASIILQNGVNLRTLTVCDAGLIPQ